MKMGSKGKSGKNMRVDDDDSMGYDEDDMDIDMFSGPGP